MAFAVAIVYLFLEWHGRRARDSGLWLVALVLRLPAPGGGAARAAAARRELFHSPLFGTHVFARPARLRRLRGGGGYGFLFLRLYRELKRARFSTFFGRLPPLEVLERMMSGALMVGFFGAHRRRSSSASSGRSGSSPAAWLHDPKIVFTLATWALYGGALLLRRTRRWQGRQTALASLAGLGAILFSLLAVNTLFSGFHGFF